MKGLNLLFAFLGGAAVGAAAGIKKRRYGTLGRPNCRRGKGREVTPLK